MDLRNAMEYIAEQAAPHVVEINGDTYTDKRMTRIPQEMRAEPDAHKPSGLYFFQCG